MEFKGLNSVYVILERIGNFQYYFEDAAKLLAAICFTMAVGMMCIKIWLGGADARNEFIKLTLTLIVYLIMINVYPVAMKGLYKVAMNLGYGAVFDSGKYELQIPNLNGKSESDFYRWMGENSFGIFTNSSETDEQGATQKALELNIVDGKSGYFDLNKVFKFMFVLLRVLFKAMPAKWNLLLPTGGLMMVMFILGFLIAFVCFIMCLINYITCLIDYFAMVGFGIIMIPLSLWEGTKSYTGTLLGSMGKIFIKLLFISAFLYLSVMSVIDLFVSLYVTEYVGVMDAVFAYCETCLYLIFQSVILFVITKQTTSIAGFLSGGNPAMSFGEFAQAAMQSAAVTKTAMSGGKAYNQARANAQRAVGSAVASGGAGAIAGGMAASLAGGGAGAILGSALKSLGGNLGGNLVSSLGNAASSAAQGIGSIAKNPEKLGGAGKRVAQMFGANGAMSSEGFSLGGGYAPGSSEGVGPLIGGGSSGGSSSTGGGGSDSTSKYSGGFVSKDGTPITTGQLVKGSPTGGGSSSSSSGGSSGGGSSVSDSTPNYSSSSSSSNSSLPSTSSESSVPSTTSGSSSSGSSERSEQMKSMGSGMLSYADNISNSQNAQPIREHSARFAGHYMTNRGNGESRLNSLKQATKNTLKDGLANSANRGSGTKLYLSKSLKDNALNGSRLVLSGSNNTSASGTSGNKVGQIVMGANSGSAAIEYARQQTNEAKEAQRLANS